MCVHTKMRWPALPRPAPPCPALPRPAAAHRGYCAPGQREGAPQLPGCAVLCALRAAVQQCALSATVLVAVHAIHCTAANAVGPGVPCATGKKAYPASLVGAQAVGIAGGSHSDEIVRLYLED